ncbi:SusD/RagB family nutrient-binding outer membrane lipoprotein [Spirosoma radiotolerans]|uniref:SusD/RagB family nutrient-binding outer membrane lipoprotein n=1 Tax=Spirosoma radiotolerans TaxID=1379870 RepID=UPI00069863EC|nr:SusD/RagB family nutrient-binding outer membrane lipoprotein [Spirosoma radiotolerans]
MKSIATNSIRHKLILGVGLLVWVASACTDYMETLNQDNKLITDKQLEADANEGGILLPLMQNRIVATVTGTYQLQQNLNADVYSGMLMTPTPFLDNKNNTTYSLVDGWNGTVWSGPAVGVLDQWLQMKKKGFDTKYPDLYAIALMLKVAAAHRMVDVLGPLPYTKYGNSSEVAFDSEEEAYNAFFAELDQAINTLTAAEDANPTADLIRFAKFDKTSYAGDYKQWVKMANTLRLRLAVRIAKVSPAKAKTEAEAAVNHKWGVLADGDKSFQVIPTNTHPLEQITYSWSDIRLAAPVETYLTGFKDPRLPYYAVGAKDGAVAGQIKGIRAGVVIPEKGRYQGYSELLFTKTTPIKIMDVAESYFLRAEGVLRGWNMGGGSAKDFYENGIRLSFKTLGVAGVDTYLNSVSTQTAYVDPKNADNNSPALTNITVKWEDGVSLERQLERIITQKWIAIWPEGVEGWSEFRRTGYPKLYPIKVNNSGGAIPDGEFIKRLVYPTIITNASKAAVDDAVKKHLDNKDSPFTPIWWDID